MAPAAHTTVLICAFAQLAAALQLRIPLRHAISRFAGSSTGLHAISSPYLESISAPPAKRERKAERLAPAEAPQEKDVPQFDWEKQWYPMQVEEYADKSKPHSIQLLGRDLVLWHDGSEWRCYEDACPHRLAPLSQGRVEPDGTLMCAYHAWRFSGPDGACVNIPQSQPGSKEKVQAAPRACAKSYPVSVTQGVIFVWPESGPLAEMAASVRSPPVIPELEDQELLAANRVKPLPFNQRDLPYGWDMFFENVLDSAHVPVSHHGLVGNRYNDANPVHFDIVRPVDTQEGMVLKMIPDKPSKDVESTHLVWQPPGHLLIRTTYKDGGKTMLSLMASPSLPGRCLHLGRQILIKNNEGKTPPGLAFFALPLPVWLQHATASLFLHQDMVFLHAQQRLLQAKGVDNHNYHAEIYSPTGQDRALLLFRRWLAKRAGGDVPWAPGVSKVMPRLPDSELFDVYNTHTKHCTVCLAALKNFQRAITALRVAAVASVVAGVVYRQIAALMVLGGAAALASVGLEKFSRLWYSYEYSHQDNN